MSDLRWTPAPGWPPPPDDGWAPPPGWQPDPSWPAAPAGWNFWQPVSYGVAPLTSVDASAPTEREPGAGTPDEADEDDDWRAGAATRLDAAGISGWKKPATAAAAVAGIMLMIGLTASASGEADGNEAACSTLRDFSGEVGQQMLVVADARGQSGLGELEAIISNGLTDLRQARDLSTGELTPLIRATIDAHTRFESAIATDDAGDFMAAVRASGVATENATDECTRLGF